MNTLNTNHDTITILVANAKQIFVIIIYVIIYIFYPIALITSQSPCAFKVPSPVFMMIVMYAFYSRDVLSITTFKDQIFIPVIFPVCPVFKSCIQRSDRDKLADGH